MRRTFLVSVSTALTGSMLTIGTAFLGMIPSWSLLNGLAPLLFAIASIVIIIRAHRRLDREEVLEDWQYFGSVFSMATLVLVVVASLYVALVGQMFGPYPERTYTFEGSRPVYLFENSCFPPDSRAECDEYWTEIRTPIGFLPVTRTIVRCDCFYAEPVVTSETIKFEVEDTYVPDTPPAIIDRRTMRLMTRR